MKPNSLGNYSIGHEVTHEGTAVRVLFPKSWKVGRAPDRHQGPYRADDVMKPEQAVSTGTSFV